MSTRSGSVNYFVQLAVLIAIWLAVLGMLMLGGVKTNGLQPAAAEQLMSLVRPTP